MSFEYKFWLSPQLYTYLYQQMVEDGDPTVKQTIKRLLTDAAQDKQVVANALALIQHRKGVKDGSHPVLPK